MTGSVPIDRLTRALETDPRFCAAVLFGSAARDALRAGSDVDIAVMYADDAARKSVAKDILTVLGTLGMVARRDVHLGDLERADPGLRRTLLASGRVLFDHAGGRFRRLHEKRPCSNTLTGNMPDR